MKIRTQNLLAIVPLFLFLAVASSLLISFAERRELLWGLREEASSLAVASAEFIDGQGYATLVSAGTRAPYFAGLSVSLERILHRGQARRIFGLSADGGRTLFTLDAGENGAEAPASATVTRGIPPMHGLGYEPVLDAKKQPIASRPVAMDTARFFASAPPRAPQYFVSDVRDTGPGDARMTAMAPIADAAGRRVGILGVETDAEEYVVTTRRILGTSAWITGIVLLVGTVVALGVSGLVTHEVQDLTRAAVDVKLGNLDRSIQPGRIQEVGDLAGTFNTMSAVLKDVLSQTRRTLIEGEQFRTEEDLAEVYNELFWPPLSSCHDGVAAAARQIGKGAAGSFHALLTSPHGGCAVVGRVGGSSPVTAALEASAACLLLQQEVAATDADTALRRVKELFDVERLECLCWDRATMAGCRWSFSAAAGCGAREPVCFEPGRPLLLSTLRADVQETVNRYASRFARLSPEELLADINAALPPGEEGSLMILCCDRRRNG
jgi:HAMP domain-containing protein